MMTNVLAKKDKHVLLDIVRQLGYEPVPYTTLASAPSRYKHILRDYQPNRWYFVHTQWKQAVPVDTYRNEKSIEDVYPKEIYQAAVTCILQAFYASGGILFIVSDAGPVVFDFDGIVDTRTSDKYQKYREVITPFQQHGTYVAASVMDNWETHGPFSSVEEAASFVAYGVDAETALGFNLSIYRTPDGSFSVNDLEGVVGLFTPEGMAAACFLDQHEQVFELFDMVENNKHINDIRRVVREIRKRMEDFQNWS